jgi:hypothetical protein
MPFKKDWYSAPWNMNCPRPADWVEVWWGEQSWELDKRIYESYVGRDLEEDLQQDPEGTYQKLLNARSEYTSGGVSKEAQRQRECACCGNRLDVRYGEYEEVGNSVVCPSHNVEELSSAGVI